MLGCYHILKSLILVLTTEECFAGLFTHSQIIKKIVKIPSFNSYILVTPLAPLSSKQKKVYLGIL